MIIEKYNQLITDNGLQDYREQILAVAKPCKIGVVTDKPTNSFVGGLPMVDEGFAWPQNFRGEYLSFIAQIEYSEFDQLALDSGYLLFFYDNRSWISKKGNGHIYVIFQDGKRQFLEKDLPSKTVKSLFGLLKKQRKPNIYNKAFVKFENGLSFPSLYRDLLSFEEESVQEEAYIDNIFATDNLLQIGGYPQIVQDDVMESDCVNAMSYGQPEDWELFLQISELSNMTWGDSGKLFWFLHKHDMANKQVDNICMVSQCC